MAAGGVSAGDPPLPRFDGQQHLGVATCAASTCHGRAKPSQGNNVLQNEYLTWHRRDAHAEAYAVLDSQQARRMTKALGLGPPRKADACLECHADNVDADRRGPRFQIEDGVGCEACHGGAEGWIDTHADKRTSHADNLANGLYPTEDPVARTRMCMSCHYSHPEQAMTHRLMSAGHPKLLFDIDTFTQIQPRHHRVDADYRRRKRDPKAARTWALGEVTAATVMLKTVADELTTESGMFPELYHFDCAACHHEIGSGNWVRRPSSPVGPGEVRLEDASLRLLRPLLAAFDGELAERWSAAVDSLHRAAQRDSAAVSAATDELLALAARARARLVESSIDEETGPAVLRAIARAGASDGFADHTWADQAVMAQASLLTSAAEAGWFTEARQKRLEAALDGVYAALETRDYRPKRVRKAMRAFDRAFKRTASE